MNEDLPTLPLKKLPRLKSMPKNSPRLETVQSVSDSCLAVSPRKKKAGLIRRTSSKLLGKSGSSNNIKSSGRLPKSKSLRDLTDKFTPRTTKKEKPESPITISSVITTSHVQHVGQESANQFLLRLLKLRDEKFAHVHHEIHAGPRSGYIYLQPSKNMANQFRSIMQSEELKHVSHFFINPNVSNSHAYSAKYRLTKTNIIDFGLN